MQNHRVFTEVRELPAPAVAEPTHTLAPTPSEPSDETPEVRDAYEGLRRTGHQVSKHLFVDSDHARYELSQGVSAGATCTFHVARRTPPDSPPELVGIKAEVPGPGLRGEAIAMIVVQSPLAPTRVVETEKIAYLVLPLCDGAGDLAIRYVHRNPTTYTMIEQWAADCLHQVTTRLRVMHKQKRPHRDIKPDNILYKLGGQWFLCDFGAASGEAKSRVCGTLGYASPNVLNGHDAGLADDIFSLGATGISLVMGTNPFHPDTVLADASDETYDEKSDYVARDLMGKYLIWATNAKAPPQHVEYYARVKKPVARFFAELNYRAPTLAPLLRRMVDPDPQMRPTVFMARLDLETFRARWGEKTVDANLGETWKRIRRDPSIAKQIRFFGAPIPPPLRRSTTFDGPNVHVHAAERPHVFKDVVLPQPQAVVLAGNG